jgi:hypothetical protein
LRWQEAEAAAPVIREEAEAAAEQEVSCITLRLLFLHGLTTSLLEPVVQEALAAPLARMVVTRGSVALSLSAAALAVVSLSENQVEVLLEVPHTREVPPDQQHPGKVIREALALRQVPHSLAAAAEAQVP